MQTILSFSNKSFIQCCYFDNLSFALVLIPNCQIIACLETLRVESFSLYDNVVINLFVGESIFAMIEINLATLNICGIRTLLGAVIDQSKRNYYALYVLQNQKDSMIFVKDVLYIFNFISSFHFRNCNVGYCQSHH